MIQEKGTNLGLEIRKVLTPEQLAQLPAFSPGTGFGPVGVSGLFWPLVKAGQKVARPATVLTQE